MESDEYMLQIFKMRSLDEIFSDCYIKKDFFEGKDLKNNDMIEFEKNFRSLFNPYSDEYCAKYIMFKSSLIPAFLRLKKEQFEDDELQLYVFIKSVISSMNDTCLNYVSGKLSAAYFIYDMSIDYNNYGNNYLGLTELYPDFFLAPYLIDEGIRILYSR